MRNARILYVEDDLTLSFVTRDNLQRAGYSIDSCEDGVTAYEKIVTGNYDLYILDVMLPKIDGYTLARKIREKNEAVPILFLSAKSTIDDKIYGLHIGADDYITKPFSIEELILKSKFSSSAAALIHHACKKKLSTQSGNIRFRIQGCS